MAMFIKLITTSLACVLIIAICGVVFGFLTGDGLTLLYAYNSNFVIGSFLVFTGIVMLFLPGKLSFTRNNLIDHSTYLERTKDERDVRQGKGYELIFLGILIIIIAGTAQVVQWIIMR